ncbi:cation diffusion facilitator family transporter [Exiguobacterium sp. TDN 0502]|uniref:cation diffusion facilitator family transporter n=1 Tax=Exiguobacterium sp. TDN 0502 TaxID=3420731 RepID=UPI003D77B814
MAHDHHHHHTENKKVLRLSFLIITLFMIVEVIGGFWTNSLALLSDAGHMLSDSISLAIALLAFQFSNQTPDANKTYGSKRFEILAAIFNGVALIVIALYIFVEAVQRFLDPPDVATTGMLIISVLGLLVNLLVAWIMTRGGGHEDNLNMRGAYLHVLSDMLGSIGAIAAALLIIFFGWGWADPIASVIVALLVLRSGYHVTKASIHVLMEGTPSDVDIDQVVSTIQTNEAVLGLHDLHIWSITSGYNALSCHVVVKADMTVRESESIREQIDHDLKHVGIDHATIQVETKQHDHGSTLYCDGKQQSHSH